MRYSLPPDTVVFTGRASEVEFITGAVAAATNRGGVLSCTIDGMPGLGKTALAIHVAHLLRPQFPDRQLFIDLHGYTPGQLPMTPEAALASLLAVAGVDARSLPAGLAGRQALWRDRLAGQRALLVLDNAASSQQVAPLLPGGGTCLVLITSRRHLGDLPGAVVPVMLDALPPGEAAEMFRGLAPRASRDPGAEVARLARLAGFLPLAISLLARCDLATGQSADGQTKLRQAHEMFQRMGAAETPGVAAELDALAGEQAVSRLGRLGMTRVMLRRILGHQAGRDSHPVTVTIADGPPGPSVPADFAGLSFERGPLNPGHAGVDGYLFRADNDSLVTLFRNVGLRSLRIGGGSVDFYPPAGTGPDGFTGVDNLFAFAATAGAQVIYSFRLLSPASKPVTGLKSANAEAAGHIWGRYRENVASFAIGNEPDWHAFHSYPGHPHDPAIYEEAGGVPGSAYPSYVATWHDFAAAVGAAAPGVPLAGPDTGAYTPLTYTPDPDRGVSWTERFARDERDAGRVAVFTQHYYVGGSPGKTSAWQAISNMLSEDWVTGTEIGSQPAGTEYIPYPWFYARNLAPVRAAGLSYRLTESNDYLTGVPGASNAFAAALWALDHLHWWAAHGAAGVNFHNKQWLYTDTIVPDPAAAGRYAVTPKGYGIKAFTLGSVGQARRVTVGSTNGLNLTAYCVGDCVTLINKTHGRTAADAAVTIRWPGPALPRAEMMTLASAEPGDPGAGAATLGGAAITGDAPWAGQWTALPGGPGGLSLTVPATSAAIIRIHGAG